MNETSDIDYEQIINLIQSILSLEHCLQYQIIPLSLDRGCLSLGMVNPEDETALDFIRPIVNDLGYSLHIQHIDSYAHQLVLAAYLKHNHTVEQAQADVSPQVAPETVDNSSMKVANELFETDRTSKQNDLDSKATIVVDLSENPFNIPKTSVEDSKSTIYASLQEETSSSDASSQLFADVTTNQTSTFTQNHTQNQGSDVRAIANDESSKSKSDRHREQAKNLDLDPFLDFDISTLSKNYCLTDESLETLTPQQLWQELFTNILNGSIAQLSLERNSDRGRILWSQDEIVQSSVDDVSLSIFQALINEIKTLAKIPLEPLQKTKKVAINRQYQQERLQLRIDLCPNQWGEEITIQVLRGKALKLYEQKQIAKIKEQALLLAQKLAKTLTTMGNSFDSSDIGDLGELRKVKQEIDRQLELLD